MPPSRRRRDTNATSNNLSLDDSLLDALSPLMEAPLPDLTEISDRRLWHPDPPARPSMMLDGRPSTRLVLEDRTPTPRQRAAGYRQFSQTKAVLAFSDPDNTIVCVRRKSRREVLFAKRYRGRGRGRPRRMQWFSKVRC